ncbi:hypothetical protein [Deinococcus yavapaiensis]|nr:hypothetical protein [Deinococcus yavapaiensis]
MTIRVLRTLLALLFALAGLAAAQVAVQDHIVRSEGEGRTWSRTFERALGPLVGPVDTGERVWIAAGPQLYALSSQGAVLARLHLPGEAVALDGSGGELRVTVRYGAVNETFGVVNDTLDGRVVYPPLANVTSSLERAAREGLSFDPRRPLDSRGAAALLRERARRDPSNPFTLAYLSVAARNAGDAQSAQEAAESALQTRDPFFVLVRLARFFDSVGQSALADRALDLARQNAADLGYDPALPMNRAALLAYGNPLGYLDLLLDQQKTRRADAWIRHLRVLSPRFEGYRDVYARYADVLEAQGRDGEAFDWRRFSDELSSGTPYNLGPNALLAVRDVARLATLAVVASLLAMLLSFGARAWTQQGKDLAPLGGRYRSWARHPLSRLRRILLSYWGFGEKLVLVALLAALLVVLGAWTWSSRTYVRAGTDVLNFGTYGGAWFYDGLERLGLDVASREARFVRGLAAQLDDDTATAREQYGLAGKSGCNLNNVGVLLAGGGDPATARARYRDALALSPNLVAPAYNLGLEPGGFETNFQRAYRVGPRLCYPDARSVGAAVDGVLTGEIRTITNNPWAYLTRFPSGLAQPLQWAWVGLLLFACGLSFLWLLVPRVPGSKVARRPWRYRLLAFLFPGVAFLDVAWGLVLLLAWATSLVAGGATLGLARFPYLLDFSGAGVRTTLLLALAVTYGLNTLLLLLDEVAHVRRVRATSARA